MERLVDNRLKSVDTESNEFEKFIIIHYYSLSYLRNSTACKWRNDIVSLSLDALHGVFLPKQIMEME